MLTNLPSRFECYRRLLCTWVAGFSVGRTIAADRFCRPAFGAGMFAVDAGGSRKEAGLFKNTTWIFACFYPRAGRHRGDVERRRGNGVTGAGRQRCALMSKA